MQFVKGLDCSREGMDKDVSQSLFYSHDYVINVIVQAFDKIVFKGESETHLKVTSMVSAF